MSEPDLRVLVVDDSVVARNMLTRAISRVPAVSLAGSGKDGDEAVALVRTLTPDLVTLDVNMARVSGLEALKAVRAEFPRLPVLMVSSLTRRGAEETVEALMCGASGYITKPDTDAGANDAIAHLARELTMRLSELGLSRVGRRSSGGSVPISPDRTVAPRSFELLALGASTGGPAALMQVLSGLPRGYPVPIVVTQHMPLTFTALLARRLDQSTGFQVAEGQHGELVYPGQVRIAPGGFHMKVTRSYEGLPLLALDEGPPLHSCRPAVDAMLLSAAPEFGSKMLAVVLTGMGVDGREGCREVRQHCGVVLAQDEESSVVWGMPGSVVDAGLAHCVLPLEHVASKIARLLVSPAAKATA